MKSFCAMKESRRIEEIKIQERKKRDKEAHKYIWFVESIYGAFRSKAYTHVVLTHMKPKKNETWLDAGSGVGRLSLEIAPLTEKIFCSDHSLSSLRLLKTNAKDKAFSNVHVFQCDICSLACLENKFNGILCNEVLQHIPSNEERVRAIYGLYKALRPGGRCIVNVIHWRGPHMGEKEGYWGKNQEIYRFYFTKNEIESLMKDVGFKIVFVRGLDIIRPRLCNALPISWIFLEGWLSRFPFSSAMGNNLLAIGQK